MPRKAKKEDNWSSDLVHAKVSPLEEKIIENLVSLQKAHLNLAEKFDKLSDQITILLSLFEMAARSFAENPVNQISDKDKEFLEKVDKLLEQNKTIAKGLTLMDERIRDRLYGSHKAEEHEEYESSLGNHNRP